MIAFIILGNTHKTTIYPIPKIDAQNRPYIKLLGLTYEIESGRGVVDIGQCQLGHMVGLGQLQEFEFGKGSETKAVICVTIEIDRR